jgi:hypothetical protein
VLAFACPVCDRLVTFESTCCLHCGSTLGFDPRSRSICALGADGASGPYRCANAQLAACNWLVSDPSTLCSSCALTRTRPNDADDSGLRGFAAAEASKRRLLFELTDMGLPVVGWQERPGGLAFDLLSSESTPVTTGHADGVITLDLGETDPAHRERMRVQLGEPYRTVLGHLRHEVAHYYQPLLVLPGTAAQARCRELFGDEREDYQAALDRYYDVGAPSDWETSFVSAYATMHPWEDWAETFAHYLHIRDTLQTAAAYGMHVDGPSIPLADSAALHAEPSDDTTTDIRRMLETWIPMTYALNSISRSMGELDVYPFVLAPEVETKLVFIHTLVRGAAQSDCSTERMLPAGSLNQAIGGPPPRKMPFSSGSMPS